MALAAALSAAALSRRLLAPNAVAMASRLTVAAVLPPSPSWSATPLAPQQVRFKTNKAGTRRSIYKEYQRRRWVAIRQALKFAER
jgi:hypothetical protein